MKYTILSSRQVKCKCSELIPQSSAWVTGLLEYLANPWLQVGQSTGEEPADHCSARQGGSLLVGHCYRAGESGANRTSEGLGALI